MGVREVRPAARLGAGAAAVSARVRAGGRGAVTRAVSCALFLPLVLILSAAVPATAQAQPVPISPVVLDGPNPAIPASTGLTSSIARDGTGGLVYLKQTGGVPHVFLSVLAGGIFQPPVQVDAGLPGPASQPVIGASNGGALIVAFINAGNLYVVSRPGASSPLARPRFLAGAATNPSAQMTPSGKGYVAFAVSDRAGFDVRAAYYHGGAWALESAPLNAYPGDVAGTGSGHPAVAAAGDGVAIVAWGEGGQVFTRRVWGTAPSVVFERADGPLPGCTEVSADRPALASGGDSSYAAVAFREVISCAGGEGTRVLVNRLQGSRFDGVAPADGLSTPTAESADGPAVVAGEYGAGWVTSWQTGSGVAVGDTLGSNEQPGATTPINPAGNASPPYATPAMAGYYSSLIAWQHDPGSAGSAEISIRYAERNDVLGPEVVLSSPTHGPTDAAAGLTAGGNVEGEAAVAWVQDAPGGREIVVDQLLLPPPPPGPLAPSGYVRSAQPRLNWGPSSDLWGPDSYVVSVDGKTVGQGGPELRVFSPLSQGRHTWAVYAVNRARQASNPRTGSFFVDTVAPRVKVSVARHVLVGAVVHMRIAYTDAPAPLPARDASGVARVIVRWGDRTKVSAHHTSVHSYRRAGRYRVTVTVLDRAGNRTVVTVVITVKIPPTAPAAKGGP